MWQGGMCGRGACVTGAMHGGGGMCGGGHAWQGVCMARGACMAGGACVAGGHVWQGCMRDRGHAWQGGHVWWGACIVGGMHGRGVCMAWRGVHGRYYEIRSMNGRYTSYWNAFLFVTYFGGNMYE